MRIATLQFSAKLGLVDDNIARADSLLTSALPSSLHNLDLLVLPELAFTGYNHPSLPSIHPHLEPTASGPSTQWAIRTAARLQCLVTVGYPELYSSSPPPPAKLRPTMIDLGPARDTYYTLTAYNSSVTVNGGGEVVAHHRKSHLFYTDETWAQEGPEGFTTHDLDFSPLRGRSASSSSAADGAVSAAASEDRTEKKKKKKVRTTFAICMDLNPHHFLPPPPSSSSSSLTSHILRTQSALLVLSTAWLTHLPSTALAAAPEQPDLDTLRYWFDRLLPLIRHDEETICVFANRCGEEAGGMVRCVEEGGGGEGGGGGGGGGGEGVRYAGSSWVGVVGKGRVRVGRVMERGEEGVCGVVDTEDLGRGGGWEVEFREREAGEVE